VVSSAVSRDRPVVLEFPAVTDISKTCAFAGFFVAGLLFGLLGAILPAWRYHIDSDFAMAGNYFLSLGLGVLASAEIARRLLLEKGASYVLGAACAVACAGLLILSQASPPVHWIWRLLGLFVLGCGAGTLRTASFQSIAPLYRQDPSAAVNLAGLVFGSGSLLVTLLISGAFYAYSISAILLVLAAVPAAWAWIYVRKTHSRPASLESQPDLHETLRDFRRTGPVLLALLLFFQLGNEWSVAGWLPVFLVRRLGISPERSLQLLALFWFATLAGRVASVWILRRISHAKLLFASAAASVFGCTMLLLTDKASGAGVGLLLVGLGFAAIYPLVAERIGRRFPYYRPGFFNGIFTVAITGAMIVPCLIGYGAAIWDCSVAMVWPLLGACLVFLLVPLIWLESKLNGI
jgi:fucose permease